MLITKKRKLKINKKKTQKGSSRKSIIANKWPTPSIVPPGMSFPEVPKSDPILKASNDDCYNASKNLKELTSQIEIEKQNEINGIKRTRSLCAHFNNYITELKKNKFYTEIYIETFAPQVLKTKPSYSL